MHFKYLTKDLHINVMCTLHILYMPMDNTNNDLFIYYCAPCFNSDISLC